MQDLTPIYTALKDYAGGDFLRLHMPGHIGKGILGQDLSGITLLDITEVPGMDDLHLPVGVIRKSQELLARAFAAKESFFLVNGATSGIHALFMALGSQGQEIMVPRNAHRSFYGGMVLSGAVPVYIPVENETELGIALAVKAEKVKNLLIKHKEVTAVFITSPSYYGTSSDIKNIASVTRARQKKLLVDEAHGAHFCFNKQYPRPALESGADAVVNGLHKTMPVLNQGACLHLASSLAGDARIKKAVSMLTTTSPSYPLLASMELACRFMEENGDLLLARAAELSSCYRCKINKIKGLKCCEEELRRVNGVKELDPLKVLISVRETGLNGYQFARLLRDKYHIQVEMQEQSFILAMFSIFHDKQDWERFYQALWAIAVTYPGKKKQANKAAIPPLPRMILSPRQAFMASSRRVALKDTLNQVAAEMIAAYPPGIPCILPGELIDQEMLDYLDFLRRSDVRFQGPEDTTLEYINIIED